MAEKEIIEHGRIWIREEKHHSGHSQKCPECESFQNLESNISRSVAGPNLLRYTLTYTCACGCSWKYERTDDLNESNAVPEQISKTKEQTQKGNIRFR